MAKIGKAGPQNIALLDTEKGVLERNNNSVMLLDEDLAKKLKFIKEGEFVEKDGATALKLVGDIVPIDKVEVVRHVKENLTKQYPFSALELVDEVKKRVPTISQQDVWACIAENDIKNNSDYSAYNFRNKKHEDAFHETRSLPVATPSIYNQKAVDFIVRILQSP